jgi:hypothetical protein
VERSGRGLIYGMPSHLPGGTEENHENRSPDSRYPGRYLNQRPPEYETGGLTIRLRLLLGKDVISTKNICTCTEWFVFARKEWTRGTSCGVWFKRLRQLFVIGLDFFSVTGIPGVTGFRYTFKLRHSVDPQVEVKGVRSGDRGDHKTGPFRLTDRSG